MSNLLDEVKHILSFYGICPKRRMGQNFVVDEEVLSKMVEYANLDGDETVLEVGSGLGFLTERLAESCFKVVAVEIDPRLVKVLKNRLRRYRNVEVICGDVFRVPLPKFDKVVSTPPYSISSKLILWLLEVEGLELAALTLQDEFARRLAAQVGSRDYSRLTVTVYYRAEVEALDKVSRYSFYPTPKVDSRIVLVKPRSPSFKVRDLALYRELVKSLFTQRKRRLKKGIIPFLRGVGIDEKEVRKIAESLPFSGLRVKDLAPEDFALLSDEVVKRVEENLLR
ncbi:MAG: 16S rRNA (adenine(1518)-N(6)/adenine(1519)-N(6))-dimethyltransferase RsmA [Candidatus Bathyarchaeia archaeon]